MWMKKKFERLNKKNNENEKKTWGGSLCSHSRLFKVAFDYFFVIEGTNTEDKNIFGWKDWDIKINLFLK